MNLTKKLAPRRLARAILALGPRTGNGLIKLTALGNRRCPEVLQADAETARRALVHTRITITVETERLLIVSHVRDQREDQNARCP